MADRRLLNTREAGWLVVYVGNGLPAASIVAGRLATERIRTWVHQEPVARAFGIYVGSLGEVKVLVHPEDYARARAILDADVPRALSGNTSTLIQDNEDDDNE